MTTSAAASAEIAKVAQTAVTTEELLSGDSNILDQLLLMFEKGLNQPIVYWQLASILGSLLLAWLCGKYIRMRIIKHLAANEKIESEEIKAEEDDAGVQPEHRESAFWAKVRRGIETLILRLSFPLLGMCFIAISTFTVRLFGLLPKKALPLESIAWLILGAYVVIRTMVFILHSLSRKYNSSLDNFLTFSIWGGVALQIVGVLPKLVEFMQTTKIPLGSTNATVWSVFLSGFSIALALFIAKWIGQFF